MTPTKQYLAKCQEILQVVDAQYAKIAEAADLFANTILAGRMVHVFGSGHSRIMVEELWPRYGSFPGFNPMVELSLTFHHDVVGTNGQRQAMFIENTPGLAERILRNYHLDERDSALVIGSSGCSVVTVEMAEGFKESGVPVVGLISAAHSATCASKRADGKKLQDFSEIVLDSGAPEGDAMVHLEGLDTPVAPGSTVGGCMVVNCLKAEIAKRLVRAGKTPKVLTAANVIDPRRAAELFEAAYDEHGARLAQLLHHPGALE